MTERIEAQTSGDRGARLREIREALEMTQREFAAHLTGIALALGLSVRYEMYDVSVREIGRRALDAEDYAILSFVDPKRWTWHWLAFGEELKVKARVPLPRPSQSSSGGR